MRFFEDGLRTSRRGAKDRRFAEYPEDTRPLIVAEGDSWFEYPFQKDIVSVLSSTYRIRCLARAGDTWKDVIHEGELGPTVAALKPDIVLLSVGGNDIVDRIADFVRPYTDARPDTPAAYIARSRYEKALDDVFAAYQEVCRPLVDGGIDVIVSGYDHPDPRTKEDGGQWLGPEIERLRKLHHLRLWHEITRDLIDRYDVRMRRFAASFNRASPSGTTARFTFVSQIGAVNGESYDPALGRPNEAWNDEMHPFDAGFRRLADRIAAAIEAVKKRRKIP